MRPSNTAPPGTPRTDRLTSRYEIHELLGRGGMASVYRAIDRSLSRQVALKQLTIDAAAPERSSARGAVRARVPHARCSLRHPHVIEVYDYGVGDRRPPVLHDGAARRRRPARSRAPAIGARLCDWLVRRVLRAGAAAFAALAASRHQPAQHSLHRSSGRAKLIDFGAMAPMGHGGADVVGTPAFTAPETLQRSALDARTDLYSLGATLYFALTARLALPRAHVLRVAGRVAASSRCRRRAFVADIPPRSTTWCSR